MVKNSIYNTLAHIAGNNSRKLAIAYLYSIVAHRSIRMKSKDPLIGEGQNVYVGLDTLGRHTLNNFEERYIDIIKEGINNSDYHALEGTVEETVLNLFNKYDFENSLKKIGESLRDLVNHKPNFDKPLEEITAGHIQRNEQRAIKKELSKYI